MKAILLDILSGAMWIAVTVIVVASLILGLAWLQTKYVWSLPTAGVLFACWLVGVVIRELRSDIV